jgi:nitrate reductase alpha subunit
VVLQLAPETNGHVAVKAWQALSKMTGREHSHLALHREDEKIRFRDIQAQPRKIISSPTWSGLESEKVSYNAGYTNVHELIPWRTLTGCLDWPKGTRLERCRTPIGRLRHRRL